MLLNKKIFGATIMCLVVLVLAFLLVESSWHKTKWEQWLTDLEATNGKSPEALVGFKDAGSKATPYLMHCLTNSTVARSAYVEVQKKLPKKVGETLPEWSPINFMRRQRAVLQALAASGIEARQATPAVMWALTNIVTAYYAGGPATAYDPHVRSNALVTLQQIDPNLAQSRWLIESEVKAGRYGQGGLVRDTADRVLAGASEQEFNPRAQ